LIPIKPYNEIMNTRLIVLYTLRETLSLVGMGVALFWSAGQLDWWPGWAALAVMTAWIIATAALIFHYNPGLLAERQGPRPGAKTWDTAIVSTLGLTTLLRYIVAGLDHRNGWTGGVPVAAQLGALILCVMGYALFTWATAANAYFSQVVRIQSERGHTVVSGGPYHFIRHPAYLGALVYELAVSVLLASGWSFIFSAASAALLLLRTALEDRALQNELAGYAEYARRVRYRLIPAIW
jgi:protein-S-isoprenylcysteine O-methyltransferase Ste14